MKPFSVRAVVLAGGRGSRMPPLVSVERPKALLTVVNRPMLFYTLFSLFRAKITEVTVIVDPLFRSAVSHYVSVEFPKDAALSRFKDHPSLNVDVHARSESAETADALRELDVTENDVLILSSDSVNDIDLGPILDHHRTSNCACTVTLTQAVTPTLAPTSTVSKSSKSSSSAVYTPQLYALINDGNRLLAMLYPTDLESSTAVIRHTLIQRYDHLSFLSDVQDPHIYCFHTEVLHQVLQYCPAISSVKYDLIPYVARRQHTLCRVAELDSWLLPNDEFFVSLYHLPSTVYSARANTVDSFKSTNMEVASGKLSSWLNPAEESSSMATTPGQAKQGKKKEKKARPPIPFSPAGERVSVTPDSVVGTGCSAGDRTSVKKSIIGNQCVLGSNVKLNGCVLLSNVLVKDGANLTSTVVCENSVISASSTLKDCRVAADTTVDEDTEAQDRSFGGEQENEAAGFADGLGDELEFF